MLCAKCNALKEASDFLPVQAPATANGDAVADTGSQTSVCVECRKAREDEQREKVSSTPFEECKVVDTFICTRCGTACTNCSAPEYVMFDS